MREINIEGVLGVILAGAIIALIVIVAFALVPLCGIAMLWFIEDVLGKEIDTGVYWAGIGVLSVYALVVIGMKSSKGEDERMTNPCEIGLSCPFKRYTEEGDAVCAYPYGVIIPEDETFGLYDEVDCPIVDPQSPLDTYLMGYAECNGRASE